MENDVLGIPVRNIPFMEGERKRKCLNATFLALNITGISSGILWCTISELNDGEAVCGVIAALLRPCFSVFFSLALSETERSSAYVTNQAFKRLRADRVGSQTFRATSRGKTSGAALEFLTNLLQRISSTQGYIPSRKTLFGSFYLLFFG